VITSKQRHSQPTNRYQVALPTGNTFGITAATPENPDSFEVFKFVLESASGQSAPSYQNGAPQQPIQNQPPPANPPSITSSGNTVLDAGILAQFVDLGGRLQLTNKATNTILQDMRNQAAKSESRHAELQQNLATKSEVAALDARLQRIETLLQSVQRDVQGRDYSGSFSQLHDTLRSSHLSLTESLQSHVLNGMSSRKYDIIEYRLTLFKAITASTPRMGFFIFMVIAFQVLLAVSYIIYKRRRANMPKKFL